MSSLLKAELLIQQSKFDLAEKELRQYLVKNPNDGFSYSLLAITYLETNQNIKALESAEKGVGLNPTNGYSFYVLSRCYIQTEKIKKAEEAIKSALHLNPDEPSFLGTYAAILCDKGKKEEALKIIDRALEIEPEDNHSKTVKSIILRSMGRFKEADNMASESLYENPEDSSAFIQKGWSSLDLGKTKEALNYFKSAVMIDPTNEFAKSGLVMALKAQNFLFNLFYKYYNWINSLTSRTRWFFIIGIIIFINVLDKVENTNPQFTPVFNVIFTLYIIFVFLAWTIDPIFNIFLRFNYYGKHALNKGEIIGSNIMAGLIISGIIQYIATFIFPSYPISGAIGSAFLMIPVSATFNRWDTLAFKKNLMYCGLLTAILITHIACSILEIKGLAGITFPAFVLGIVGYTWIIQKLK